MRRSLTLPLFITLLFIAFTSFSAFAQDDVAPKSQVEKPAADNLLLMASYEGWHKPDSIHTGGVGRGFNGYLTYDFPFKKSNFSFATGIGIGVSNIYLSGQEINVRDTSSTSAATFVTATKDYKKYKLTTAYLEAPFELRYFANKANRNKGFKASIGLRAGLLVGAHTKDKVSVGGTNIVEKTDSRRYMSSWRFSGMARIGWGYFSIFATYNLNNLYKEDEGPAITPYSFGICLSGL